MFESKDLFAYLFFGISHIFFLFCVCVCVWLDLFLFFFPASSIPKTKGIMIETPEERKVKAIRDIMKEQDDDCNNVDSPLHPGVAYPSATTTTTKNFISPIDASINGRIKVESEGYSWTQTEEDIEVTIPLSKNSNMTRKDDIQVILQSRHVIVRSKNMGIGQGQAQQQSQSQQPKPLILLDLSLFEEIDVDTSTWTIQQSSSAAQGYTTVLVLNLEKVEAALWSRIKN